MRRNLMCVAKYTESMEWLTDVARLPNVRIVIYDKQSVYQNVGREAETFARCICDVYDDLHRFWCITFVQGMPFDHVSRDRLLTMVSEATYDDDDDQTPVVRPLGHLHVADACGYPDHPGLPIGQGWRALQKMMGLDAPATPRDRWTFVAGAQCIVRSDAIRRYPKSFWTSLHTALMQGTICPWTMERFWMHIFGIN